MDLEKKLTGHAGEDLRKTLREQLASAGARLRNRISAGLAPEALSQAQACALALTTANDLLTALIVPADTGVHPLLSPLLQPLLRPLRQPLLQPILQAAVQLESQH